MGRTVENVILIACLALVLAGSQPANAAQTAKQVTEPLITIQHGTLPIVISAPHGGRVPLKGVPERHGVGVRKFVVGCDDNIAELADLLAVKLELQLGGKPYLVIARFERKYLDVNRVAADAYESKAVEPLYALYHRTVAADCAEVRQRWTHGLLLDLHGQADEPTALLRGTLSGKTVSSLVSRQGENAFLGPQSILGQLAANGIPILPSLKLQDPETLFSGGYIVQTYGSQYGDGVDAIQLEFGTNFRKSEELEKTASTLAAAICVFYRSYLNKPKTEIVGVATH